MTRRRKQSEITSFAKASKEVKHGKKTDKKPTPNKNDAKQKEDKMEEITEAEKSIISMQSIHSMETEILNNTNISSNSSEKAQDITINFDDPVFGNTTWCAANKLCKCSTKEATYDYWCKKCTRSAHYECLIFDSDSSSEMDLSLGYCSSEREPPHYSGVHPYI